MKVGKFDAVNGDWDQYVQEVKLYFTSRKLPQKSWVPCMLRLMGESAHRIIGYMCFPHEPEELSFEELYAVVRPNYTQGSIMIIKPEKPPVKTITAEENVEVINWEETSEIEEIEITSATENVHQQEAVVVNVESCTPQIHPAIEVKIEAAEASETVIVQEPPQSAGRVDSFRSFSHSHSLQILCHISHFHGRRHSSRCP